MLVTVVTDHCVLLPNIDNRYYDENIVYVTPREQDLIPAEVLKTANSVNQLRAGYTNTDAGYFYMTSKGNWVFMSKNYNSDLTITAGGHRRGIPWKAVGVNTWSDISSWNYTRTTTPNSHPMDVVNKYMAELEWCNILKLYGILPFMNRETNKQIAQVLISHYDKINN